MNNQKITLNILSNDCTVRWLSRIKKQHQHKINKGYSSSIDHIKCKIKINFFKHKIGGDAYEQFSTNWFLYIF